MSYTARTISRLFYCILLLPLIAQAEFIGIDFGPGKSPRNWNAISQQGVYPNLINDIGQASTITLQVGNSGKPFKVMPHVNSIPAYTGNLQAIDGNHYQFGGTFKARFSGLRPQQDYALYIFGLRSGASLRQEVEFRGATRVTFMQTAADGQLSINDQAGSNDRDLTSYARQVTSTADGTIDITVIGRGEQGSPFVVAGLALASNSSPTTLATAQQTRQSEKPSSNADIQVAGGTGAQSKPQGPDVVGVYLDMPLDEAYAVVNAGLPEIPLKKIQSDVGAIYRSRISGWKYPGGFSGSYFTPGTNEKITVLGYTPPADGKVAAIGRTSYLGDMLYTDLRASLVEKYGTPHFEAEPGAVKNINNYMLSWSLTRDGSPQKDPQVITACSKYGNKDAEDLVGYITTLWDTKEQMNGQYDKCGFTMVIHAMQQDLPTLVRAYNIVLYDLNKIRKATRVTLNEAERKAQKIESDREKSAAGKKPRL